MHWKDRSKEIFSGFSLNPLLRYNCRDNENSFQENYDFLQLSRAKLDYLFLVLQVASCFCNYDAWNLCVCCSFFTLLIVLKGSSFYRYAIFLSYFFSPLNFNAEQMTLLLFELIFHYTISKSFLLYLLSIIGRFYLYQNLCSHIPEVVLCICAFIVLTKDLKYLWAMQSLYHILTNEMHETSENTNSAHLIIDDQGKILQTNSPGLSIINLLNPAQANTLASIFQENLCDYFFEFIKTSNSDPKHEQEFNLLSKSQTTPKLVQRFSSVSIKITPILIKNQKIFVMVFNDITQQVLERKLILELTKENQKCFESVYKKYLNLYGLGHPPLEPDISLFKNCILQEIEAKCLMCFILAATDVNISEFHLKTEVINTIQTVWSTLNVNNTKFHLLIDKDISVVKADVHKHNLILKILLEFCLKYFDRSSNLMISVARLSLEKIQYKFKFYSDKLTQKKVQKIFDNKFSAKYSTGTRPKILICLHLIQVLNGKIDEIRVNSELRKVNIRFSLVFNLGTSNNCAKLNLINIPKDTVIFTWPICALPKRKTLSITKLRKIIHSNSHLPLSTDSISYSKSYES